MGTWGAGLLDSDGALDAIGDVLNWLEAEAAKLVDAPAAEPSAARLAAALGLLLELSPYSFENSGHWSNLESALSQQRRAFAKLLPEAAGLMQRLLDGDGPALANRHGDRSPELRTALGGYLDGRREPALLDHPAAETLVQEAADRCADAIDEFQQENELDLYEAGDAMGLLGLLLLLPPCKVDAKRVNNWHAYMRDAHKLTREQDPENPDLEHFDEYMANVELAFKLALQRFT
ncbi:MAG: hypothetical protein H6839_17690 [Planctomycetes bacterium]|nr:hypothetical protein [Planctomycetota bacterium]